MQLLRGLESLLFKSTFTKNIAILAGGTASAQILTLLVSPLLTRLYTPTDFGVLAVYASLLGMVSVVASLKYELAMPLSKDEATATNLLALCLGLVFSVSAVTASVIGIVGSRLTAWVHTPQLEPYLWLIPVGVVSIGLYQALNYWAIYARIFGVIAYTKFAQSLSQNLSQVGLGLIGVAPLGLLVGQVLGQAAGIFSLARAAWRQNQHSTKSIRLSALADVAQRYRRFPVFSSGSAFLNTAGLQLPALLLAALYEPQVAGWFALSERVVRLPLTFIGQSVAQVYLGEASKLALEDPQALQSLFRRTARTLFLVGLVPLGFIALVAPWLFRLVFGETWSMAGTFVQVLSLMFLVRFAVTPLSQTLNILERQDLQLVWDACRVVLVCAAFYTSHLMQRSALQAIILYGSAMVVAYIALYFLSRRALKRFIG